MNRPATRSWWICVFVFACLLLGQTQQSLAQGAAGAIAGTVKDPSGAVLKGAQVSIPAQNVNVFSDEQGLFVIKGLAPGNYTLRISYLGFATLEKETVTVAAGKTTNVAAELKIQSADQNVLVTAPRAGGEAEAINVERAADNIVQVLPAEVIRSLPNANMADALGRLPSVTLERDEGEGKYVQVRGTEPRLTNATIDGINLPSQEPGVRQVKFDGVPADSVESVQINKTLQANMDGDGIGGSVNLVTKTATDTPIISLGATGGYTPIVNGRGETEDTATVGQRFGVNKQFGILVGGSYDWNGRGIDDIEPVPDVATLANGTTVGWKDAMDIREYRYFRSRWGVNGSSDYRFGTGSDVYLRYFYSDFKNYGDRFVYSLTDNTPGIQLLNPNNVGCPTNPCVAPTYNAQLRNPDISIGNLVLGGNHDLTKTLFTWYMSASRGFYGNSPYSTAVYGSGLATSGCQYDPSATHNVYLPQWNQECFTEAYNPSNLTLNNINRDLGPSAQVNLQAEGSGARRYHIGSRSAVFEIGGKFRNVHKFSEGYVVNYNPVGTIPPIPLTTFPNRLTNHNYYNGGDYKLGYNANLEDAMAFERANPGDFTTSSTQGQDPQEFDLIEKVSAGYLMNTLDLSSRLRLVAGLRVEGTSDSVRNFSVGCVTNAQGGCNSTLTPNSFSGDYVTVLPSASLKYAVGSDSYFRFVYARGLSRPDPQDIGQALSWTFGGGNGSNRSTVSLGNPNLKAETGDDIDVLFEHYLKPFGMISAGFFYKYLQNPIVTKDFLLNNYQPTGGPLGTYLATQPVNAGTAWISGFEAAYLHHFGSLPGRWAGLGLSANYGYTASRANDIPGRLDHPRLLRTSPSAFNISPTYDRGRLSLRVGMSYNQASIYSYQFTNCTENGLGSCLPSAPTPGGVNGPLSDIYFYTHFQVDAQGSVQMPHGFTFVLQGLNLNNQVFGFYQGGPQYMIQREYYQPTFAAGVRWTSRRER